MPPDYVSGAILHIPLPAPHYDLNALPATLFDQTLTHADPYALPATFFDQELRCCMNVADP